jgi:hypothetical protein
MKFIDFQLFFREINFIKIRSPKSSGSFEKILNWESRVSALSRKQFSKNLMIFEELFNDDGGA